MEILHSHRGNHRRSHREGAHLRHDLLQLVTRGWGKNAMRWINRCSLYEESELPCRKHDLQQDDPVDHRSNSVRWYQHHSGAKSGNQLERGLNLGSDNIAWLHFSVIIWFAEYREHI